MPLSLQELGGFLRLNKFGGVSELSGISLFLTKT